MRSSDGRQVLLASRHDPEEEARRWLEATPLQPSATYVVLGMGMGYHVLEIERRRGPGTRLVVFEADVRLMRAALERLDFSGLLASGTALLHAGGDLDRLFEKIEARTLDIAHSPVQLLAHGPSSSLQPEYYERASRWTTAAVQRLSMAVQTEYLLAERLFENRFGNLFRYLVSPTLDELAGRFRGVPAVIVSAGPSLHRSLDRLAAFEGRAVLIAVSTALKVLLHEGIRPTFAAIVDFNAISKRYFDRLDHDVVRRIPLLCDPRAAPEAIGAYPGPLVFNHDRVSYGLTRRTRGDPQAFERTTNVASFAFDVAGLLGCGPVVFVGQDLAYSWHVTHVPGTAIYAQWLPQLQRFHTLETREWEEIEAVRGSSLTRVEGQSGGDVYTDCQMSAYRVELERKIAACGADVINASEGGARIAGARAMPLAAVLEAFAGPPRPEVVGFEVPRLEGAARATRHREAVATIERIRVDLDSTARILEAIRDCNVEMAGAIAEDRPIEVHVRRAAELEAEAKTFAGVLLAATNLAVTDSIALERERRRMDVEDSPERRLAYARMNVEYARCLLAAIDRLRELTGLAALDARRDRDG